MWRDERMRESVGGRTRGTLLPKASYYIQYRFQSGWFHWKLRPLVWDLADAMNALMALPNLVALFLLSGVVVAETRTYLWDKHLDQEGE
jgi:Na+/alanine symporter